MATAVIQNRDAVRAGVHQQMRVPVVVLRATVELATAVVNRKAVLRWMPHAAVMEDTVQIHHVCKSSGNGANWLLHGSELHCVFVQQPDSDLYPIYQGGSYNDQSSGYDDEVHDVRLH